MFDWTDITNLQPGEAYAVWRWCVDHKIKHGMTWNDWLFYVGLISRKTWSLEQYAATV